MLRTQAHFGRFVGERVHVELKEPRAGRRRYTGKLLAVDDGGIALEVDREPVALKFAEIGKARLAPIAARELEPRRGHSEVVKTVNKEILMVVDAVSNEKGVDKEVIFEALEAALAVGYPQEARRGVGRARIDRPQERRLRHLPPLEGVCR